MSNWVKWLLAVVVVAIAFFVLLVVWATCGVVGKMIATSLVAIPAIWAAFGFTIVEEGTSKIVLVFGSFSHCIMAWKDHDFRRNVEAGCTSDNEWDIVSAPGTQSASGLRWIGFRPIFMIVKYNLKYRAIELLNGREVVETHDLKNIDYFTLKPHMNWLDILDAETAGEEGGTGALRFNLEFLLGLQIINPYKAHYAGPANWNQNVISRFSALLRAWVTSKSPKELLTLKRDPRGPAGSVVSTGREVAPIYPTRMSELCQELLQDPVVGYIKRVWGIAVIENGIEIRDLGMTEKLQEAFAAEQEQKLLARGLAAKTADPVMQYLSAMTGDPVNVLQKKYKRSPGAFNKRYKKQMDIAKEMAEQTLPLARGRTQNMFPGADGIGKLLLGLVKMARGGGGQSPSVAPATSSGRTNPPRGGDAQGEMSPEEANVFFQDEYEDELGQLEEEEDEEQAEK